MQALSPELYDLHHGDCLQVLKTIADNSVDSVVTDPPYALTEVKTSAQSFASQLNGGRTPEQKAARSGFMGMKWDTGDIVHNADFWAEVLRILKPGGHLAAFSGSRTYHRMACAIEDAGFQVRDQIMYVYGTGFPKSRSMRDIGRPELGTSLKPAHEPICLARKPLSEKTVAANVLRWGTGAINVDGCRIGIESTIRNCNAGTGDATQYRTGVRASVNGSKSGRFPANLCHDGSQEVLDLFPESKSTGGTKAIGHQSSIGTFVESDHREVYHFGDGGSAARFFYCAKASKSDRAGSKHPTVKPIKLMQWLCRLITPPGGVVLDPFAGSGTTGAAAILEGFRPILIEREDEYVVDIRRRLAA